MYAQHNILSVALGGWQICVLEFFCAPFDWKGACMHLQFLHFLPSFVDISLLHSNYIPALLLLLLFLGHHFYLQTY